MRAWISKSVAAAAAALGAAAVTLTGTGVAHAGVYQYSVQLISHQFRNQCLTGAYQANQDAYLTNCDGTYHQRWNVTSYDTDVNGYYSRVEVQNVYTHECLGFADNPDNGGSLVTRSCDYTDPNDQWHVTWVGNDSRHLGNAFQLWNLFGSLVQPGCLDAGQNDLMYPENKGTAYCTNRWNNYQIWDFVG